MKIIDLRSDTVTQPTPAMMAAIAQARLGDDVWGDDPTVIQLQEIAAEKLGTEDSLFVPSGTMGNLIAALVHCQRSDELILGDKSHIFRWEVGNLSAVGGIHPHLLSNRPDGTLALEDIEAAIRPENVHFPDSRRYFWKTRTITAVGWPSPPNISPLLERLPIDMVLLFTWMGRVCSMQPKP